MPLIVSGLNVADVGRESTALVNTTDLFSTALELLGVNVSTALAGVTLDSESILPILQDAQATGSRDTVYVEAFQEQCSFNWRQAIRDDQYKLLRFCPPCTGGECCYDSADCSEELYAVSDVLECCDLAGDPNYDDEREALRLLLPAPPGADIECRAGDLCKGCCQDSDCSSTTGTCHLDVHECCPDPYAGLTVQWDGPPGDPEPRGISTLGDYEAFNMVEGGACVHNLVLKTAFDEDSQSQVTQYRAGRVQGGAPDSLGIVTASWEGSNFGNITV